MEISDKEYLAPGHRGCAGCGASIGVRLALNALGKNTVAISATGCLEVMTSPYPETAWEIPWMHVAFSKMLEQLHLGRKRFKNSRKR